MCLFIIIILEKAIHKMDKNILWKKSFNAMILWSIILLFLNKILKKNLIRFGITLDTVGRMVASSSNPIHRLHFNQNLSGNCGIGMWRREKRHQEFYNKNGNNKLASDARRGTDQISIPANETEYEDDV